MKDQPHGPNLALSIEKLHKLRLLLSDNGFSEAQIFGSQARGDATESSDLDLLLEPIPGMTLVQLAGLKQKLEEALGIRVYLAFARSLPPRIADQVLSEARPL